MSSSQVNTINLCYEECAYTLISSSTVHVDGCAQRQNEAGNLFGNAQLTHAAHVQRQSATGGAGAERHENCRSHCFHKGNRANLADEANHGAVNDNCMQEAGKIYSQDNLQQRQQNSRAVSCNNRSDQAENADRSNSHDHANDFVGNLSQTVDSMLQSVSLFANSSDAYAQEQSEYDDLQHVSLNHCFERIGRENVNNNLRNRRCSLCSYLSNINRHMHAQARLNDSADCQADNDSKSSRAQVIADGLNTDTANLFDIAQAGNTHYQAGEYQRNDDHFDHVHKNCAKRSNPGLGKANALSSQL